MSGPEYYPEYMSSRWCAGDQEVPPEGAAAQLRERCRDGRPLNPEDATLQDLEPVRALSGLHYWERLKTDEIRRR